MITETLQTPYGIFGGVGAIEYYPDGRIQSLRLTEQNVIVTHAGELIPFYGEETLRRKNKASVTFHRNGMIKAVALEEAQEVITPIGALPAELITFYDTGEVARVFPLDGKISGFWSEEDERTLNFPLTFDLGFTSFTAMLSCIAFFKSGRLRSLTLFPQELIELDLDALGQIKVRHGLSLYEDGTLQSIEPATPTAVRTPLGSLLAFDVNAHGINADSNSLCFDQTGRVTRVVTSGDRIFAASRNGGRSAIFQPKAIEADEDGGVVMTATVEVTFDDEARTVTITDCESTAAFSFDDDFVIQQRIKSEAGCASGDCSACHKCGL